MTHFDWFLQLLIVGWRLFILHWLLLVLLIVMTRGLWSVERQRRRRLLLLLRLVRRMRRRVGQHPTRAEIPELPRQRQRARRRVYWTGQQRRTPR